MEINIDDLADGLKITTAELKDRLAHLGLMDVVNEAERLEHREAYGTDKMKELLKYGSQLKSRHLRAACRKLLPELIVTQGEGQ